MKILITGAGGRVGSYLARFLGEQGHEISSWGRGDVDFSAPDGLKNLPRFLEKAAPDAIINCAAISSLEMCLDDPVTAHRVNAMMPESLARFCDREGVKLIHFSTDYVLDGRRPGKKGEDAKCKPINIYGESKYEAELRLHEYGASPIIARVSWVFGNSGKPSFPESIIQKALAGLPLEAVEDKFSLPTSLTTISRAVEAFLAMEESGGVYHLCDSGEPVSWREYAQGTLDAAACLGLDLKTTNVQGIGMASLAAFRDPRPVHTAMDNAKLSALLGGSIPDWRQTLADYLSAIYRPGSINLD